MDSSIDNFLDFTVSLIPGKVTLDLFVKPIDSHQYLHSSSFHPYHCKQEIPYSQAVCHNRICSNPNFLDIKCNDLEEWLREKGCKEVQKQILRARGFLRDFLVDSKNTREKQNKITCNLTYYPIF